MEQDRSAPGGMEVPLGALAIQPDAGPVIQPQFSSSDTRSNLRSRTHTHMVAKETRRMPGNEARYCCLEYRPVDTPVAGTLEVRAVLLLVQSRAHGLRFYVHPKLLNLIHPDDRAYFESLLEDLLERATRDPDRLFQQMSTLGVGLLVTQESGVLPTEFAELPGDAKNFVPLEGQDRAREA
jgi:hypothetical protein